MLNLEEIQEWLRDKKLKLIAEESKVSHATLWRISKGKGYNVGYLTVSKISDYILFRKKNESN